MPKLPHDRIRALHEAAIACNLSADEQQDALLSGLPPTYRATLPSSGNASARLMLILGRLNEDERLRDRTVPLEVWLTNALALAAQHEESAVFEEALRTLRDPLSPRPPPRVPPLPSTRIKVLFLAANPTTTTLVGLARELREIEQRISTGKPRDAFELSSRWAVRPTDLQRALLEEEPHVLHFSGHGSPRAQLILEDDAGKAARVDKDAFVEMIGILLDNLRLVVLNACDTEAIAEALVQHVDFAVGMHEPVGDDAAIVFAAAFYQALGFGRPVDAAFRLGCNQLRLKGIPEEQTPRLKVKAGLDAAKVALVRPR